MVKFKIIIDLFYVKYALHLLIKNNFLKSEVIKNLLASWYTFLTVSFDFSVGKYYKLFEKIITKLLI